MFEVTEKEIRNLTIAFFVLTFCFAISTSGFDLHAFISIIPIVMIGCAVGSILHELGHKYAAMKYGCQAEFELWPLGLAIAVASSFFGVVFATPDTAHIYPDDVGDEINGKISVAGPMANITLALMALMGAALIYPLITYSGIFHLIYLICTVGFSVNSFLAAFNLLPVYSLDGTKVLKWSIKIWVAIFAVAAIMVLMSISIGAENMVLLLIGA